MRALVIGSGSIGRRHIASLRTLSSGCEIMLMRQREIMEERSRALDASVTSCWDEAIGWQPDVAVIATPTDRHLEALQELLPRGIPCYVEKPVVANSRQLKELQALMASLPRLPATQVGCNLRYLPSLARLRELMHRGAIGRPVRASLQVGQWLPDWRPTQDYRASYSADAERGGGVIMDLVHELDAARWLFGDFEQVRALGGHYSTLDIRAEDCAVVVLGRAGGPVVGIGMDYIARKPIRRYEIVGDEGTLVWDLGRRSLIREHAGGVEIVDLAPGAFDVAATYQAAMRRLLDACRGASDSDQGLDEGVRSAALAILARRMIES